MKPEDLVYNPFLAGELVDVILGDGSILDGKVIRTGYDTKKSIIDTVIRLDGLDYIINFMYYLVHKCYVRVINIKDDKFFKSRGNIKEVIPKSSKLRDDFQDLIECNFICRLKGTRGCINCIDPKEIENNLKDKFLLGDKIKFFDGTKATIVVIKFNNGSYEYGYRTISSDIVYDTIYVNDLICGNLDTRLGYLKRSDNNYYCDKCIFQECSKCLIKML